MKSIIKKKSEVGLWLEDSPIPTINDHDVLVKIHKTSICGTDLNIYNWSRWAQKNVPVPLIVGHEFVGEIVEIGKAVKTLKTGDRVTGEGHITCGHCPNCKKGLKHLCMNVRGIGYHTPGCFAEYFVIPEENIFVLPETIQDKIAAVFDPFGNAVHAALSFDLMGEQVLITGAGPIGIMAVAIAKKAGATNIIITDVNPYRLDIARQVGADAAVNVTNESIEDAMASRGIRHGFTVGLEMSGNALAFNDLLHHCRHGAKVALLGILPAETVIDWDAVIFKMLTLKGIYGREIFSTWYKMVNLIENGLDLEPIITHEFEAEDFESGFKAMQSGNCGKVILNWT